MRVGFSLRATTTPALKQAHSETGMTYTLVATAKNEGPALLEWVAYHKMIGFDHVIIYQNDSDDLTHETLKALRDLGEIDYFYNRAARGRHQVRAYKRAGRQARFREADWAMALDLDEFLVVHCGGGQVADLVAAVGDADLIMVNWRRFGSAGATEMSDRLIVEQFQRCEPEDRVVTHLTPYKAMFRPRHFGRCGVHRPADPRVPEERIRVCNGSGLPSAAYEHFRFRAKDPGRRALAQINHYITKDAASFVLKAHRGSAHQANRAVDAKYWRRRNFNDHIDPRLAARSVAIEQEITRLDAASDHVLRDLRARALALHRARFEALMADPDTQRLYALCAGQAGT